MIKFLLFTSVLISKGSIEFYVYPFTVYSGNEVFTTYYFYTVNVAQIPIESKGKYEQGEFDIEIDFKNLNTGKTIKDRWTKKFKLSGHTELTKIYDVFSVNLEKGEYEVLIRFSTRAKRGEIKFRQSMDLRYPFISDVLMVPNISKEEKYFFKIQNISFDMRMPLRFVYPDTVIHYYYELYGFKGDEKIVYEIVKDGNIVYSQEEKAPAIEKGFTSGKVPIYKFGSGEMEFKVKILKGGKIYYEKSEKFVYYSRKRIQEESVKTFYENYLFFIDYFAKPDEMSAFKRIKDFEGKKLFVQKFWKKYDPDTSTEVNEFIYELVDRINFADQNFSLGLKRKGRFTDRGRIYIKYGKPAEVENSYYPEADRAWESWIYNEPRRMQFIFVDINQDGNYVLIYSSVPEEQPSRADWRKWIPEEAIEVRQ